MSMPKPGDQLVRDMSTWAPSPSELRALPPPTDKRQASPLPTQSEIRKTIPLASGCFDYFPAALAAVAELSHWGNEKHNSGEPLHDARTKSQDDADCLLRHFTDRGKLDEIIVNGKQIKVRHSTAVAWRALRILQKELEADGAPLAPGARL
jgi:hypothetical protein